LNRANEQFAMANPPPNLVYFSTAANDSGDFSAVFSKETKMSELPIKGMDEKFCSECGSIIKANLGGRCLLFFY
jgi:hypothetical protein